MPVTTNYENGKCFARYGKEGHKYFYQCGDESSKEEAKKKAVEQGQAIIINEGPIKYVELKKWRNNANSSNVNKIMYNDEIKELVIKFNSGDIYTYSNIEFDSFRDIVEGNAVCVTSGDSKWGSWDVGKTPSVGAAVFKYLVERGATYRKGGTLR